MSEPKKIEGTEEAWEEGKLGRSINHVKTSDTKNEELIDESLGLQPISIRLQKDLIEELKIIARFNGIGYQPLIKQVLRRFTRAELKKIAAECVSEIEKEALKSEENSRQTDDNKSAA